MKTFIRNILLVAVAFATVCMSPSAISTSATSPNVASTSATSPTTPQWIQIRTAYRTALNNSNHIGTFETACKSHSQTDALANAYYATALALWDWMFGTLLIPDAKEGFDFGVAPAAPTGRAKATHA